MSISLKWGSERLHIAFPGDQVALGALREHISGHIGVPKERLKMIKSGAVMNDDSLTLAHYGIHAGTSITLVGSADVLQEPPSRRPPPPPKPEPKTEQSTINAIRTELAHVSSKIQPDVTTFLQYLRSPTPPAQSQLRQTHAMLGELLLQSLLKLDSIIPGEWEEARKERKVAVKQVQKLLDDLDAAWQSYVPRSAT